jgi:hypothetical protein
MSTDYYATVDGNSNWHRSARLITSSQPSERHSCARASILSDPGSPSCTTTQSAWVVADTVSQFRNCRDLVSPESRGWNPELEFDSMPSYVTYVISQGYRSHTLIGTTIPFRVVI